MEAYNNDFQAGHGYLGSDSYPVKFQVTSFPELAKKGSVAILANNQAFFFVSNPRGNTEPQNMSLNPSKLKELLGNILEHGTDFTMLIDADVVNKPEQFVEKYYKLRSESEEQTKKALLLKEAELISGFIKSGGIIALVQEIIKEKDSSISDEDLNFKASIFLQKNFRIQGVEVKNPLSCAVWQVDAPNGKLLARIEYKNNTHNVERPCQLGIEPSLKTLNEQEHPGAKQILDAVKEMNAMRIVNFTSVGTSAGVSTGKGK